MAHVLAQAPSVSPSVSTCRPITLDAFRQIKSNDVTIAGGRHAVCPGKPLQACGPLGSFCRVVRYNGHFLLSRKICQCIMAGWPRLLRTQNRHVIGAHSKSTLHFLQSDSFGTQRVAFRTRLQLLQPLLVKETISVLGNSSMPCDDLAVVGSWVGLGIAIPVRGSLLSCVIVTAALYAVDGANVAAKLTLGDSTGF